MTLAYIVVGIISGLGVGIVGDRLGLSNKVQIICIVFSSLILSATITAVTP